MDVSIEAALKDIVQAIVPVLPNNKKTVALHEPCFEGNEWRYTKNCIDTGWVSSAGEYVNLFEQKLAEFTGIKYAIVTVNGTAALHTCLLLAGVREDDEVLMPALTFVATANAVRYCNAYPHFVDSEFTSLGVDVDKLRDYLRTISVRKGQDIFNRYTNRRIRAIVPMHTFGHPIDLDNMKALSEEFSLILVEDAAESLGSYYKGHHTGSFGLCSALSFNGNKIVTTGGGGAVLTDDAKIAALAKHITTTAKVPHKWAFYHDMLGYNYRMPNINAAIGCAQLENMSSFIRRKRALAQTYKQAFASVKAVKFIAEPDNTESNYWLQAIMLDEAYENYRDYLLDITHERGIMARPAWELMYKLPMYTDCPRMPCEVAESIAKRIVNIPSSANLINL